MTLAALDLTCPRCGYAFAISAADELTLCQTCVADDAREDAREAERGIAAQLGVNQMRGNHRSLTRAETGALQRRGAERQPRLGGERNAAVAGRSLSRHGCAPRG